MPPRRPKPKPIKRRNSVPELIPPRPTLPAVRDAAADCRACDLWERATQTVFGKGKPKARLMFVGEQPGDQEDRQGRPFVGPAGGVLDRALDAAGIDRTSVYLTNVVKHFSWEPRGKWRIHKKPKADQIAACRPWLDVEIALIKPLAIVCLGATAAQALLGSTFRVTQHRGEFISSTLAPLVLATVHPRRSCALQIPKPAVARPIDSSTICDWSRAQSHEPNRRSEP